MAIQIEVSARITVRLLAISARLQCWGRSQPAPVACTRLPVQSTTLARHVSKPLFPSSRCTLPLFVTDRRRAIRLLSYFLHAPIVAPNRTLKRCLSSKITTFSKCCRPNLDSTVPQPVLVTEPRPPPRLSKIMQPHISSNHFAQAPAMVMPSMRSVGEATEPRKTRSLPMAVTWRSISARLPAMVISSTAWVSWPFSIHKPVAPRE